MLKIGVKSSVKQRCFVDLVNTCNVTDKRVPKSNLIDFQWEDFHHFQTNLLHFGTLIMFLTLNILYLTPI